MRPERGLLALVVAQTAFWTLAPSLSHSAPPLDVVEMYAWGREGVLATFKHPNLPGLVLEPTRWLTGQVGWPAYLVSQVFIAATFWAVFVLGRELMDGWRALAGVLLLTGVYFFSWPTPEFNHNVAQMPFWALVMLGLWRASSHGRRIDWILLGVFAGLSLWAKYSSAVLLAVAAGWVLWDAHARRQIASLGPWLGLAAFALTAAPQALWLIANDFSPFAYAARRASGGEWYAPLEFVLTLVLDHLPMLALLLAAGLFGKSASSAPPKPDRRAMAFLLAMGLAPIGLMTAGAALSGAGLRASWGAPMVVLSGLIAVALLNDKISPVRLARVGVGAGVLIVVVSGLYFAHMRYGAAFTGKPLRGNWPQGELSASLEQAWSAETGGAPLEIVAGDIWTAGLVGMSDRAAPSVLIDGDLELSPWVSAEDIRRSGALVVWPADEAPAAALASLSQGLEARELSFAPTRAGARPIRVRYAVLAPAPRS